MFCNKVMNLTYKQISRLSKRFMSNNVTELSNMEKTINQITLLGRVGGDPQKRGTDDHPVVLFSLATHTNYKMEGGDFVQRTDWHRICIFKRYLRDIVYDNLKKGQRVFVSGRVSYGEIKDEDGKSKMTTSVIADDVIFFQNKKNNDN